MKKMIKRILIISCLISTSVLAGYRHVSFNNATTDSSVKFIEEYYANLKKGMTRSQYSKYWTKQNVNLQSNVDKKLSTITGQSIEQVNNNTMSLTHILSNCENAEFIRAKVYGSRNRRAEVIYHVVKTCNGTGSFDRVLKLIFSKENSNWLIKTIEDKEIQL